MQKVLLSLGFLILSWNAFSQENMTGFVYNSKTQESLSNAHIYVKELKKGILTNDSGYFFLDVKNNSSLTFHFSFVGFSNLDTSISITSSKNHSFPIQPKAFTTSTFVVTATRNKQETSMIPASVKVIDEEQIESQSASNTDNFLQTVSGVYVNRSSGIFSRNASVSLRGLSSSARTLILLDGVPINHAAGGTINWHMIPVQEIKQIEIIKGPSSAVYGMNAMGGVINILTKTPQKGLGAEAEFGFGNYNTSSQRIAASQAHDFKNRNVYWSFNVSNKIGEGYYQIPDNLIDWYDAPLSIRESKASVKIGSLLNSSSSIENNFFIYDDIRFSGAVFYEARGSFEKFKCYQNNLTYYKTIGKTKIDALAFFQREDYYRQSENINNTNIYKLNETYQIKDDIGLFLKFNRSFYKNHMFTSGLDVKKGLYDGEVIYRTTTDILNYGGNMLFTGIYAQDEFSLWNNKLNFNLGIRFDYIQFSNGSFSIENPTSETGFIQNTNEIYTNKNWQSVSPKFGIRYHIKNNNLLYISISKGFMPPKTDDIVRSGKISKGFKIANPDLKPETLVNYETGFTLKPNKKLTLDVSVYKSFGKDFLYLLQTGDSIDMGDDSYRQIYKRRNIAEIEVLGIELDGEFKFTDKLYVQGNYTFNQPIIVKLTEGDPSLDYSLVGNYLAETPIHQLYSSICWNSNILNSCLSWNLIVKQFADDENLEELDKYYLIDLRFNRKLGNHISVNLDIQNILNQKYLDRKGNQSIGRFILFSIKYKI